MTHASIMPAWTTPSLIRLGSVYVLEGDKDLERDWLEDFYVGTGSLREEMGVVGFQPTRILGLNLKKGERTC